MKLIWFIDGDVVAHVLWGLIKEMLWLIEEMMWLIGNADQTEESVGPDSNPLSCAMVPHGKKKNLF